jgi:uncharacterized coiled-coil DUF342 family protein
MKRLTKKREAEIRAYRSAPGSLTAISELLAELDEVKAERDEQIKDGMALVQLNLDLRAQVEQQAAIIREHKWDELIEQVHTLTKERDRLKESNAILRRALRQIAMKMGCNCDIIADAATEEAELIEKGEK